jgi:hypothetical protein
MSWIDARMRAIATALALIANACASALPPSDVDAGGPGNDGGVVTNGADTEDTTIGDVDGQTFIDVDDAVADPSDSDVIGTDADACGTIPQNGCPCVRPKPSDDLFCCDGQKHSTAYSCGKTVIPGKFVWGYAEGVCNCLHPDDPQSCGNFPGWCPWE